MSRRRIRIEGVRDRDARPVCVTRRDLSSQGSIMHRGPREKSPKWVTRPRAGATGIGCHRSHCLARQRACGDLAILDARRDLLIAAGSSRTGVICRGAVAARRQPDERFVARRARSARALLKSLAFE
jgi:hypothetical protein